MMVLFFTQAFHHTILYHDTNRQCIKFNAFTIWKSVKRISCCFFVVPLYTTWACYFTIFHKHALHFKSPYVTLNRKYQVSVNICTGVIWRMKVFQSEIKWAYRIPLGNLQIVHFYQVSICLQIYFWFHPLFAKHQILLVWCY